jgi:acyl carrier protein
MNGEMINEVQRIVADILAVPKENITPESSPSVIEAWDSLNHLNLILALEQEFAVRFTPEEISEIESVQGFLDLLDRKMSSR